MKTESNSMVGTAVGAVGGLGGDGALCAAPKKGDHTAQALILVVFAVPALPGTIRLHRWAAHGSARTEEGGAALSAGGLRCSPAGPRLQLGTVVDHDPADRDGGFLGQLDAQRSPHGAARALGATN